MAVAGGVFAGSLVGRGGAQMGGEGGGQDKDVLWGGRPGLPLTLSTAAGVLVLTAW